MFIVYGVYNLGRGQRVFDRTHCDICGKTNRPVVSYSAREFVHLMFVPLVPLGKNRIVRSCGTCKHFYKLPLKGSKLKAAIDELRREALARIGTDINHTLSDLADLAHMGDFEGAESIIKALDGHSQGARWLAEARFLTLKGDDQNAEASFRKALELDRTSGTPDYWFGHFLLMQGRDGEAVAQLSQAVQRDPGYEYSGLLHDFHLVRKQRRNWAGLATIMAELVRLHPEATGDKTFSKLYAKACRKAGRATGSANPYAQA